MLSNAEISRQLVELAQLLSVRGENPYKVRAYRRAAETIAGLSVSLDEEIRGGGDITHHPNIGAGIATVLGEMSVEGKASRLEKLRAETPPELTGLADFPALDPRQLTRAYKKLGVNTIAAVRQQLAAGVIEKSLGRRAADHFNRAFSTEVKLLLFDADPIAASVEEFLRRSCGATRIAAVGDFRRRVEVVGDLTFLVEVPDFARLVKQLQSYAGSIPLELQEVHRARFRLPAGIPLTVEQASAKSWGFAEIIATGSAGHLAALERETPWRMVLRGKPSAENESQAYKTLGLPYIPPELREDQGEVQVAQHGKLPALVKLADLRGDLHAHTNASDGWQTIEVMAERAREKGYAYFGITDHSQSLKIARGVSGKNLWAQIRTIDRLNERGLGIRILKSAEVDILADGRLDYPDELLAELDYTVCSIHSQFRKDKAAQTERILRAMDNRHFGFMGHATGRLLLKRSGYEFDLDRVISHAAALGRAFEINASPDRLDLSAESARMVAAAGIRLAINTDAHHTEDFEYMRCGIDVARRAGLTAAQVLNTLPLPGLLRVFRRQ